MIALKSVKFLGINLTKEVQDCTLKTIKDCWKIVERFPSKQVENSNYRLAEGIEKSWQD